MAAAGRLHFHIAELNHHNCSRINGRRAWPDSYVQESATRLVVSHAVAAKIDDSTRRRLNLALHMPPSHHLRLSMAPK